MELVPWLALAGVGIGLVTAPTTNAVLGSDERIGYGATAAVFNTFRTTGLTLGVAIMGAILGSFGPAVVFSRTLDPRHHADFVDGFAAAVTINSVIALMAAVLAAFTLKGRGATLSATAPQI
jgi:Na+/melibiose symporter-like transporter